MLCDIDVNEVLLPELPRQRNAVFASSGRTEHKVADFTRAQLSQSSSRRDVLKLLMSDTSWDEATNLLGLLVSREVLVSEVFRWNVVFIDVKALSQVVHVLVVRLQVLLLTVEVHFKPAFLFPLD